MPTSAVLFAALTALASAGPTRIPARPAQRLASAARPARDGGPVHLSATGSLRASIRSEDDKKVRAGKSDPANWVKETGAGGEDWVNQGSDGTYTNATGGLPDWVDNPIAEYFIHYTTGPKIWKWHNYFHVYHKHMARFVGRPKINMLVIGVQSGGEIGMWQHYFGKGLNFVGVDVNPGCKRLEKQYGVKIVIGDQGDTNFLKTLVSQVETPWDIVIDDGGHLMMQQITSFELLYPHVHKKGVFITEDATTSYHPMTSTYRKGSLPQGVPYFETPQETFITHMKYRVDYLNGYWINPEWAPTDPFVTTVDSIAFYDGMVVVEKRPHPHPTQERRGTVEIPYCAPGQTNGCLS